MTSDKNSQCFMAEDLIKLKMSVGKSQTDIEYIKDDLVKTGKLNRTEHAKLDQTLKDHFDKLEKKIDQDCAGKWVEKSTMAVAFAFSAGIIAKILDII